MGPMKQIQNSVLKLIMIPWRSLVPLQNDNLKITTKEEFKALRTSLLNRGITDPLGVWDDHGKIKILDGHRRRLMFEALEKEGFKIPAVPCVSVKAKNEKEAKQILLSNISQYGKTQEEGLYEYMHKAKITFPEVQSECVIPGVDLPRFGRGYFDHEDEEEEKATEKPKKKIKVSVTCPKCKHQFAMN